MLAPSRGKINNVNNKLTIALIYLLPQPPPSRWRHGRLGVGVADVQPPHAAARPPPHRQRRGGTGQVGRWVSQGVKGADVVVMVAVSAMIVIVTTANSSAAATAVVVLAVNAAVTDNAVTGGRAMGLHEFHCHRPRRYR